MQPYPEPKPPAHQRFAWVGILLLLASSATALSVAPFVMPDDYSWLSNAISESAAQGVSGAWVARLGFLSFGFAVLWLTTAARPGWAPWAYRCHLVFALFMISTAAFSHRPWRPAAPFDPFEDLLHSITATGMGFAFSCGVLARLLQRTPRDTSNRAFDALAIGAAIGMPAMSGLWPSVAGLTQRMMFLVAYAWYGREAMRPRVRP